MRAAGPAVNYTAANTLSFESRQMLFDIKDYRYVVNYHKSLGIHHMTEANRFARDCRTFIGKQLPLPFPHLSDE